ncbi:MAG: OmpH family outer membrane protein [Pseudomonadales bacterium]|nr:OmpH family outer membrane protein [Pseudomonadales bacterium]
MKPFKLVAALVFALFSMSAFAAGKIAVVNVQEAITQSDNAKIWLKKFESEHATEQADLRAMEAEIKAMQERFKKDEAILSEEEKRKTNKSMQDKYEELQFRGKQLQKEFKTGQQEFVKGMLPKVNSALTQLMEKNSYDLIVHREAVLMLAPQLDITEQVIEQLNKAKN